MGYWNMASLLNFLMFLFEVTRHCLNMEILKKENPHHYLFFLVSASCDHFSLSALFFLLRLLPRRVSSQSEEAGSRPQEKHLPPVAGCRLPLL